MSVAKKQQPVNFTADLILLSPNRSEVAAMQWRLFRVPPHQGVGTGRIPDRQNVLSIRERMAEKKGYFQKMTKHRCALIAVCSVHDNFGFEI
jgi:putative SOS response-associated peptidase YedK